MNDDADSSQQLPKGDAALDHAELGLRVVPLFGARNKVCACSDGAKCRRPAKHARISRWPNLATCDPTMIRAWFARNPHSNIGVATGAGSGVVVVDVDGAAGLESIAQIEAEHGLIAMTPKSITANGYHLWFAHPGTPVKTVAAIYPGIDVRGDGGYVVAPPSVHASGWRYTWAPGRRYGALEAAPLPAWARERPPTGGRP